MAGAVGALGIPSAAPTGRSTGGGRRRRAARPAAAASRRGRAGLPFRRLAEPERAPSRLDRDFDSIVPLATSSGGFGAGPSALDAAAVEAALVAAAPAARLALASPSFSSPPRASPPCPLATAALGLLVAEVASPPPDAPHLPPSPSPLPPRLRDAAVVVALARASLPALAAAARALRDAGPSPGVVTFSPKVFVPLTRLCRDRCGYCEFAVPPPAGPGSPRPAGAASPRLFLTPDEAVALARAGAAAGCREVLLTLGDAPEERWPEARRELEGGRLGGRAWGSTMDYLCHVASRVARETGLLPHANPGEMSRRDAARLMEAGCVSLGAMLETTREPAALPATVHPDVDAATSKPLAGTKRPARRLATLVNAGRAGAPTTTGLLVGIGETPADVVASLLAVRAADDACGGHVQECIVQPFAPKPGTPMADARPCAPERLWWACAAARLILGAAATVQSPPNLAPPPAAAPAGPGEGDGDATLLLALGALLDHGVNDWGGVSPLTPDHVSPRRPWPRLAALAAAGAERGLALAPRLAVGPGWLVQRGGLESEGLEGAAGAGHGARPGRRDGPRPDWGGGDPAPGAPPPDGGGWPGAAERATLAAAAAERWTRWGGWLSNAPLPGGGDPSASSRAGAGLPPPRPSARALALALSDADGLGRGGGAPVPPDGGGCGDAGVVGASPTDEDAPFGPLSDAWHAGLAEGESGSASPAAASAAAAAAAAATSPSPSRPADATEGGRPAPGALPPGVVRPSWRLRVSVPGEAVEGGEVGSAAGSAADSAPLYRGGAPAPRRPPPPHSQTATPALAAALRRVTDSIEAHDGTRPAPSAASLLGPSALSPPGRAEGSRTPSGSPWLPNAPLTPLSSLPPAPHVVDVARLLSARGSSDLGALISAADAVRAAAAARHRSQDSRDSQDHHSRADIPEDAASYVANRNINYTNVCGLQCAFCGFSKNAGRADGRDGYGDPAYTVSLAEIARRTREATALGCTEVCLQGGIHPNFVALPALDPTLDRALDPACDAHWAGPGSTYEQVCRACRDAAPGVHIHAFSPLEVWSGAGLGPWAGVGGGGVVGAPSADRRDALLSRHLRRLRAAGLGSLPGTAAEVLTDRVRARLCPDKIDSDQWIETVAAAHRAGLPTTATLMFGHCDGPADWAAHLLRLDALVRRDPTAAAAPGGSGSGGRGDSPDADPDRPTAAGLVTELVPLPFVHLLTPLFRAGAGRRGPSPRELLAVHAAARLALPPAVVPHLQASWPKAGPEALPLLLRCGCDDCGGRLTDESISRAAGAGHGARVTDAAFDALARAAGRGGGAWRRTTLYGRAETGEGVGDGSTALAPAKRGEGRGVVGVADVGPLGERVG